MRETRADAFEQADSLLSTSIGGGKQVVCRESEFAIIEPPSGQTCQDWLGPFIEATTGYLTNPQAESGCQYCQYRTGDEYLDTVGYVSPPLSAVRAIGSS